MARLFLINGKEEVVLPPTPEDEYEGTFRVNDLGIMEKDEDTESDEDIEIVPSKEEHYGMLIRRNFHATPRVAKSDQREIRLSVGLEIRFVQWLNDQIGNLVRKQYLVSFSIGLYQDQVLCDVLDLDACHVLLGRPWQHDRRTQHDGFTNVYTVLHEGKKKNLLLLPPHKTIPTSKPKQPRHLISRKGCKKLVRSGDYVFILFVKEVSKEENPMHPSIVKQLTEFQDVFLKELPIGLSPIRGIEHQIDLIPGASLPNKPTYRTNPEQSKEMQRQVTELMNRGFVRESLSPCVVPTLLVSKKDDT
ncbi:uncharacterized protein LOC130817733 [Amaranthus tricolor]|uniref:uncharacterized protein LOC130817733 n=1 Tax=Amaranthus tricolor TaxID=29722 RepID=UPI0025825716|nr:uncharacterized protein LOC130817733 [Amaranthus tricolor]